MEPIKKDITPSDEWLSSLNATCNRLSNQYLNLLKSASSISALHNNNYNINDTSTASAAVATASSSTGGGAESSSANGPAVALSTTLIGTSSTTSGNTSSNTVTQIHQHDPRAGGGYMILNDMVAPPPLAADVALHGTVQCQLSVENICVATSQILNLIRTLRLSLLLMDHETISAEEYILVEQTQQLTAAANMAAIELEYEYAQLLKKQLE